MNAYEDIGRWPPVYDFEQLANVIKDLIKSGEIFRQFFLSPVANAEFFQGDIIKLSGQPCYIDESGDISVLDQSFDYWIILGNTCDLSRTFSESKSDAPHLTHVSPLIPIDSRIPDTVLANLRQFKLFKKMIIPSWKNNQDYYLDFTIISSIDKQCLVNNASVEARLMRNSWFLFHACLVRYLARDDGRND